MLEVDTKPKERQIRKIILLSNNISFGPMPSADAEVEQRLTLYLDGKVFISRYRYDSGEKFKRISTQRKQLQPKQATYLIGQVIGEIIDKRLSIEATDVGSWDLTVFYEDGTRERCQGSLTPDDEGILSSLSDIIREFLESSDLFTFDGQARHDVLERFVFKYHRVTKSTLEAPVSQVAENTIRKYSEQLDIDRKSKTIKLNRRVGSNCTIKGQYYIPGGVSELLDDLESMDFNRALRPFADAVMDPKETRTFRLTLTYQNAGRKTISGYYDRDGLPLDWEGFAELLFSFISFYGFSEMLSPDVHGARRRRKDDLMFLDVVFSEYGQEYCYLSNDETIQVGDRVEVPVGADNRMALAEVVKVAWLPKEEAPIPFERIKAAYRKIGN